MYTLCYTIDKLKRDTEKESKDETHTGSFNFIEACELLDRLNGESIAIIDDNDGFCLDIIKRDELEEFR